MAPGFGDHNAMNTHLGNHAVYGAVLWSRDGAYFDLPPDTYYSLGFNETLPAVSVLSKSLLWKFNPDPWRWYNWERHQDISQNAAVLHGKLVDWLATGHEVHEWFEVGEFDDYRTKEARAWRDNTAAEGKTPVLQSAWRTAGGAWLKLAASQHWQAVIQGEPRGQVAVISTAGSQRVKGMIDVVPDGDGDLAEYLVDLKTTGRLGGERELSRLVADSGWHVQAALYLDLWNAVTGDQRSRFRFVVQDAAEPWQVAAVDLTEEAILQGRSWYLNAMSRWQECVSAGVWPSRYDEVIEVDLPRWGYEI